MGLFDGKPKKLENKVGAEKAVTRNGKKVGKIKVEKAGFFGDKTKIVMYDDKGKKTGELGAGNFNEEKARGIVYKNAERAERKSGGGGVRGVDSEKGRKGGGAQSKKAPGSGKNPHLWKNVNKDK